MKLHGLTVLATSLSAIACQGPGDSRPREGAGTLATSALQAQLDAAVCFKPIPTVDTLPRTFFPNVLLIRGWCAKEHGGTASRVAGIDTDGVVYTLDSEGAFTWLIARHPPRNLDSAHLVAYAHLALALMGKVDAGAELIENAADLPPDVRSGLAPGVAEDFPKGVIEVTDKLAEAWVVTYDGERVVAHEVHVFLPTGAMVDIQHVMWTAPAPRLP